MAKTVTQKELVSEILGGIDQDLGDTVVEKVQIHDIIDRMKNLRIRPSLYSVQKVLDYSRLQAAI